MIDYYLVSFLILPHGITDLSKVSFKKLPSLLSIYSLSLLTCGFMHELVRYGHIYLFLFSSMIHFSQDFYYFKNNIYISFLSGSMVVFIPIYLLYIGYLLFAKVWMLIYMILFHVPLHYYRIKLTRKDIPFILATTFIFGIIGPEALLTIEDQVVEGFYSIFLSGIVVGHVVWNLLF